MTAPIITAATKTKVSTLVAMTPGILPRLRDRRATIAKLSTKRKQRERRQLFVKEVAFTASLLEGDRWIYKGSWNRRVKTEIPVKYFYS
jgi:hypothetical protein